MVVLDLFAEVRPIWSSSEHFYGVPYIWCMLHNFGGNHEMYGRLDVISAAPVDARLSENSTMVGVGMCMEGIEQNPVVYELMAEMAFRAEKVHLKDWLDDYSTRRYGHDAPEAKESWQLLSRTIYNCTDGLQDHNTDVIVKFPDINASAPALRLQSGSQSRRLLDDELLKLASGHLWYSQLAGKEALALMLNASSTLKGVATYRYDLVDLTRQMLMKLANKVHAQVLTSFLRGDSDALENKGDLLLDIIKDSEALLRAEKGFLLGPWLESAKKLGKTHQEEARLYEWNARTQVTMWYDNTRDLPSALHDYANKMWSGLFQDYYLPRASIYITLMRESLAEKKPFDYNSWRVSWISLTNKWQSSTNCYPLTPAGDPVEISQSMLTKYGSLIQD